MMHIIRATLKTWLPLAAVTVSLSGLIYICMQQNLRLGANEPQVQMAEDAARALAAGEAPESLVPARNVDIAESLAPYLILYDKTGKVIASNAVLNGQVPELPAGVLDYTAEEMQDRISYQPEPAARGAVVVIFVQGGPGGYALAGRSLREVEKRIDLLGLQVFLGCAATLMGTLLLVLALELLTAWGKSRSA
jgi:hypothetical protein